jgi:glycerophosphoryl diester phosphodiesterase
MKIISHRGLLDGPNKDLENSPNQIQAALDAGYDVEIDLRIKDNRLYLGHDYEQYEIDPMFLYNDKFWIHAKDVRALEWLHATRLKYFWHQEDDYTLTSNGFIWVYPGKALPNNSISVLPETAEYTNEELRKCYSICTDYPSRYDKINNI